MEKRFLSIGGETLECTVLVVLTPTEIALMEHKDLRPRIDAIAKDLHVCWAIETNGNTTQACISKLFSPIATSNDVHNLEIIATNFMNAVNKLTLPAFDEAKCPTHEPANEEAEVIAEKLEFCKKVRNDMDDIENFHIIGANLVAGHEDFQELLIDEGNIGTTLLKELLDVYIEKYDHE